MPLPKNEKEVEDLFEFICCGNVSAEQYLHAITRLVYLADDSVDEELSFETRQEYMSKMLWIIMVQLPTNTFYREYGPLLVGLIADVLVNWQKSDEWKARGDLKRKLFGFVRRENIDGVAVAVAAILGGVDHAKAVTERIMDVCHPADGETFEDWASEGRP